MNPGEIEDNENTGFFGFRRTSEDKLTYKFIIADAINQCRRTVDTFSFPRSVQSLEKIIKFDIPGYKLLTQITILKEKVEKEIQQKFYDTEENTEFWLYNSKAFQAKLRLKKSKIYWELYFEYLIQLLAKEQLLLDTEKYIPVHDST